MSTPICLSPVMPSAASHPAHMAGHRLCLLCAGLFLMLALWWPARGHAHMMPAQQGTLNVVDNAVFGVLALPVSALDTAGSGVSLGADANGDGRLSASELQAHIWALRARVAQGFALHDGSQRGELVLLNLLAEPDERPARGGGGVATGAQADTAPDAGSRHVLVMLKAQFSQPPADLRVSTHLFGLLDDERQLTLKVTRGSLTEAVVLRPGHLEARLLQPVGRVLADYALAGVEHIVFGLDHVLFLVTLVVAGAGLRYWAGVLTAFTLAHSITLTAGLLGWMHVGPAVVEPLIAVSIVLMAAMNLWQHTSPWHAAQPGAGWPLERMVLVGACGLLHGLGFAASMADMGLHGRHQLASLVGFNLGIEIGQAMCLFAILLALHLVTRGLVVAARHWPAATLSAWSIRGECAPMSTSIWQAPVLASVLALGVGSFWLLQRLEMVG